VDQRPIQKIESQQRERAACGPPDPVEVRLHRNCPNARSSRELPSASRGESYLGPARPRLRVGLVRQALSRSDRSPTRILPA
jgi:hypothetical protein